MEVAQLPQDLIAEIFVWLPVKSLLRLKCLSKSFSALVESFAFINTHQIRSSRSFNPRKIIILEYMKMTYHVFDVNLSSKVPILCLGKSVSFPSPLWKQVYGYCKGLILWNQNPPHDIPRTALWNPSTRRRKNLPEFIRADAHLIRTVGWGLGYDESRDEYKAIYIVKVEEEKTARGKREYECWVCEKKSIFWRRIRNFPFPIQSYSIGMGNFADGCVHWLSKDDSISNEAEIAAFDVSKETFSLVPQPNIKQTYQFPELHVLAGNLCISYFSRYPMQQAELYIRNEKGSGFSWTQLYSVRGEWLFNDFSFSDLKVLGYIEGGKKILLLDGMLRLLSYDLKTKSFEIVKITNIGDWIILLLFEESLASVDSVV